MDFAKLHALGNDFLIVNAGETGGRRKPLASLAQDLCERHRGVGADGVVFFQPTAGDQEADYSMLIFNADGSKAEMSGNGVRCLAAFLVHGGLHTAPVLRVRTVAGIKRLDLEQRDNLVYRFRCSMGTPEIDPAQIPVLVQGTSGPLIDYPVQLGSETVAASFCSMGNPHCTTFWPALEEAPFHRLGPKLEVHSLFPRRTNVEFVQVLDRHRIRVRFWERGVGPTLCSGTGSSAAAVASILKGLAESPVRVETELGHLEVAWEKGRELLLTGPAEFICSGSYAAAAE